MTTTAPLSVTHRGHALHVEEEPGAGPTIVLLHGFPDDRHLHDRLVPHLAGRHVVRFDFLGWGASDKPPGHPRSAHDQTAELAAVVDAIDGPVVLVAHDSSGPPAIDLALLWPHRVAGLVLLNTYYGWTRTLRAPEAITLYSTPGLRVLARALARRAPELDHRLFTWQIGRFIVDDAARADLVPRLYADFVPAREAFWRLNADLPRTLLDRRRRSVALAGLDVPVRVVFGDRDPYLNAGVARALAGSFADAELTLVPGAGHYVQVDAPAAVAERILTIPDGAPDVLDLDRRALGATAGVAETVPRDRWDAATPCAGWTVRDVVDHLVENNRAQLAVLGGPDAGDDLRRSGEAVLAAHARPAAADARFPLGGQQRSARSALAVHFADVLVHGWDLARAAGVPYRFDEDLAVAAERVVSAFPDLAWGPGAAFAARLDPGPGATAGDRLLGLTGRDPRWRPPST
jgi:uncharacterized protein (TIGR03086 family)